MRDLNGQVFTGGSCGDYVDVEFLDLGISGGTIRCTYSETDGLGIATEYLVPKRLTDDQLERLVEDTSGQWSDGIGEQGFRFETKSGEIDVWVDYDESHIRKEQVDDGMPIGAPSLASIAARNGDLDGLRRALASGESTESRVQGMTPLHWAVLYGHPDACELLLERGADPNASDPSGNTPILLCALSNTLDDDASVNILRLLLDKGANKEVVNESGNSPRSIAENRGKKRLRDLL